MLDLNIIKVEKVENWYSLLKETLLTVNDIKVNMKFLIDNCIIELKCEDNDAWRIRVNKHFNHKKYIKEEFGDVHYIHLKNYNEFSNFITDLYNDNRIK